jgi:DNA polymerase III sliding clamp (beta) subunit (PCNA family)
MEFSIDINALHKAIKVLGIVVRTNSTDTTDVVGKILIETINDSVVFVCNNGITAISFTTMDTEIVAPGAIAIEYSKIKTFISSYKPWNGESGVNNFKFITKDRNTKIMVDNKHSNGKISKGELKLTNFNSILVTKLPIFNEVSFTLNSTVFKTATNKILYAINPQADSSQPILQGMNIQFDKDNIVFVGSNGIVLSEYQVKNNSDYNEGSITLQYDFIMGLRRLITEDIQLLWDIKGNKASVTFDGIIYVGRKIIGHEYPEYKPVLEKYTDYINLSKEFLMDTLNPFIDVLDAEDNFRLTIEIKDKLMKIYNNQAMVESDLDIAGGLDFTIDLNGKLLIQTIDSIKDNYILFKFSNSNGFAIFDSSTYNNQKSLISSIKKR